MTFHWRPYSASGSRSLEADMAGSAETGHRFNGGEFYRIHLVDVWSSGDNMQGGTYVSACGDYQLKGERNITSIPYLVVTLPPRVELVCATLVLIC